MPQYIATGKDLLNESSIKVTADSEQQAFQSAKQQLPIIWKLERIEPDGSLKEVEGLAFDTPEAILVSHRDVEEMRQIRRARGTRARRAIVFGCLFLGCVFAFECFSWFVFHPRRGGGVVTTAPAP